MDVPDKTTKRQRKKFSFKRQQMGERRGKTTRISRDKNNEHKNTIKEKPETL